MKAITQLKLTYVMKAVSCVSSTKPAYNVKGDMASMDKKFAKCK